MKFRHPVCPADCANEYDRRHFELFRSRIRLSAWVSLALILGVSGQYIFREVAFGIDEAFRSQELRVWAFITLWTFAVVFLNDRAPSLGASKVYGFLYNAIVMTVIVAIGVIYYENVSFFVFYFGIALILSALMVPWSSGDVVLLSLFSASAYVAYIYVVDRVIGYPVPSPARFHKYFDGVVCIAIAGVVCFVIRSKEARRELRNFLLLKDVERKNRQIEAELELAKRVHRTLLPSSETGPRLDLEVTYRPMGHVSGDYARFKWLEEHRALFFISDVTGHGVPAALLVNRLHSEFERVASESCCGPGEMMAALNRFICREFADTQMYLTAFCGEFDFRARTFAYSNYGHPPQYLYRRDPFELVELASQTTLLGIFDDAERHETRVPFRPGDSLLLFTDGVLEAADKRGEFFGAERLVDFLRRYASNGAAPPNDSLIQALTTHSEGGDFQDDVFILHARTK